MIENKLGLFHIYIDSKRIEINLTRYFKYLYGIKQKKR